MYQALYRTWRPQTFDTVVGQPSVTQTLRAQVDQGRLSHAYLFTGTRGTGKTSCAKILAKAVNCLHPKDGNPCNQCAACQAIDQGRSMDVMEIDAASNTGVDSVRALRDEAVYAPAELKYRVYIIDEVHMLSTAAFNALLKIIEEPPAHLIFILATTELGKIPATILSRCQRFSFRRLSMEDLAGHINQVAYAEGIDIDPAAIRLLARLGDGAMRDALSLLDQCASAATGTLTAEKVFETLGLAGDRNTARLMGAVADRDAAAALKLFSQVYEAGKSIASVLDELCALARDLLIEKTVPEPDALLSGVCSDDERKDLLGRMSAGELETCLSRLQQTLAGFSQAVNPRLEAELCLLELCSPQLRLDPAALNARLSRVEEQLARGVQPVRVPAEALPPAAQTGDDDEPPPWEDADLPPAPEAAPEAAPPQAGETAPSAASGNLWLQLVERVRPELKPPAKGFFAADGPVTCRLEGNILYLLTEEIAFKFVSAPAVTAAVAAKAAAILGREVQVRVEHASQQQTAPAFDLLTRRAQALDDSGAVIKIT